VEVGRVDREDAIERGKGAEGERVGGSGGGGGGGGGSSGGGSGGGPSSVSVQEDLALVVENLDVRREELSRPRQCHLRLTVPFHFEESGPELAPELARRGVLRQSGVERGALLLELVGCMVRVARDDSEGSGEEEEGQRQRRGSSPAHYLQ
jgi:hypothetical protein